VLALFFASGSAGLMYQVVWLRMLSRMLGVTIHATATVVAAFMAGLALGSYLVGRIVDRRNDPLRVYAVLELLVAVAAIAVPILLAGSLPLYQWVYTQSGGSYAITGVARAALCFIILLVPTTLMGGTLPVLASFLARRESLFGRSFGLLYGINTGGAVFGVLLSGFVTLGAFGERATIGIGVALNLAVGLVSLLIARSLAPAAAEPAVAAEPGPVTGPISSPLLRRGVLLAFAVSGFTALAYEIVWTRQLILFLRTSIYAFSGMLAVFLTGIALGSVVISRYVDRLRSPILAFGILELAVGLLSIINLLLFAPLDSHIFHRVFGLSSVVYAVIALVLPLTLIFGMIAPVAAVAYAGPTRGKGAAVGRLYGANTVGSILGSLAAGFLLVPWLGASRTIVVLALVNVGLGIVFVLLEPQAGRVRRLAFAGLGVGLLLAAVSLTGFDPFRRAVEARIERREGTTWMPDSNLVLPASHNIAIHEEGVEATFTAFEVNRFKQLWLNGVGMTFLTTATKLIAHLPMQAAEEPKEFLAIAFGMGTTIKSAIRYPGVTVTAVDLVPETFDAFGYYHRDADDVLKSGRFRPVVNDGRNHLLLSPKLYDVITVDPAPPIWSAGTVNLYSREFFELARSRLTPGGVFCLWFPGGTEEEVKSLLGTFVDAFPHTTVWSGPNNWGWYLLGSIRPFDWDRFRDNLARTYADSSLHADLVEFDDAIAEPDIVTSLFMWDGDSVRMVAGAAPRITDNYPFTEFPLWRYAAGRRQLWHPRSTWLNRTQVVRTRSESGEVIDPN
jgi:spermidine synthase